MTPEQYNAIVQQRLRKLSTAKLAYAVATKVHSDMSERLFDNGVMGNGKETGKYSTEPIYVQKKKFKRKSSFKGRGKKSSKPFKNKKARRTMYLPGGYKELKQVQGYESSFVNLTYSSDLRNDFDTGLAIVGDSVVVRLKRKINKDKVAGLTNKYGNTLFKHSKQEREFFIQEVTKKIVNELTV